MLFFSSTAYPGLMKSIRITLAALLAITPTFAQVKYPGESHAEQAVLATDRELDRAWNNKDLNALRELWTDDYLFIGWTGEIMNKRERLAAIRSGAFQVQSVESDEVKVRMFKDVAFLTDRERIRTDQGEVTVRSTRAFILRDGRWQLNHCAENSGWVSIVWRALSANQIGRTGIWPSSAYQHIRPLPAI